MTKVPAILIILAVLNPMCCCFGFTDGPTAKGVETSAHDCCATSEDREATDRGNQDCPHKMLADEEVLLNQESNQPIGPYAAIIATGDSSFPASYSLVKALGSRASPEEHLILLSLLRSQTDCVRLC